MYFYTLNRPSFQDEIARLEFLCLTGTTTDRGFAMSETYVDSGRPAYVDACIQIYFIDDTLRGLYEKIKSLNYQKSNYRVKFINTGVHVDFSDRKRIEREISDTFPGSPNLTHPEDDFTVTCDKDMWIFGRTLWKAENRWLIYDKKPYTFCNSLPARMARALINMAAGSAKCIKLVDPCCGMGTVVLEAFDMGLDAYGFDINPTVVRNANENLKHFGFEPVIQCRDAVKIEGSYDISIVDLPYGVLSKKGSDRYEDIIGNTRKISSRSVILSGCDISNVIEKAGFEIVESCIVHKGGLDRHITVCR